MLCTHLQYPRDELFEVAAGRDLLPALRDFALRGANLPTADGGSTRTQTRGRPSDTPGDRPIGGPAFAHYCTNASKPDGNGSAGWALYDGPGSWNLLDTTIKMNRHGQVTGGGFMDIYFDLNGDRRPQADELAAQDLFAHAGLPLQALGAAGCGRGVETPVEFFAKHDVEICPQ